MESITNEEFAWLRRVFSSALSHENEKAPLNRQGVLKLMQDEDKFFQKLNNINEAIQEKSQINSNHGKKEQESNAKTESK